MRNGRRLTAVGIITGGLLLIGLAAPSLADASSSTTGTPVAAASTLADQTGTSSDAAQDTTPTGDTGIVARSLAAGPVTLLDPGQECDPALPNCDPSGTCDDGFVPGPADSCIPDVPVVIPCPPGQTDYNGPDEDGCGTDPDACPPGQHDYNQGDPGCGVEPCPPGQTDHNGPNQDGCGTDPDACPPGQDYNGPDVLGCGTDPNACPPGQTDYNGQNQAGCGTDPDACTSGPDYNGVLAGCGSAPAAPSAPAPAPGQPSGCPAGHTDYNGVFAGIPGLRG